MDGIGRGMINLGRDVNRNITGFRKGEWKFVHHEGKKE